ncbi:hypothetical protein [Streptomyces sp. NPDC050538]|uniref:hypothetical protein n=1 Tax=Streptomyces sp. NPDC050538 TaxID=3365627 RepID=UPI00379A708E
MSDIERVDLGEVPYEEAVERMTGWVARRRAGEIPDRLALLTHPPVITYSARTPPAELPTGSPIPKALCPIGPLMGHHGQEGHRRGKLIHPWSREAS